MKTECSRKSLEFHPLGRRKIVGRFDGGTISSDAGGLLLRECERATRINASAPQQSQWTPQEEAREHGDGQRAAADDHERAGRAGVKRPQMPAPRRQRRQF